MRMNFSLAFLIALALSGAVNISAGPVGKSHTVNDVLTLVRNKITEIVDHTKISHTQRIHGLHTDLEDFLALLPTEKIASIALDYLENDFEVQKAVEYLQSESFHQIVQEVEAIEEAQNVLAYLQDAGLDAYGFLNTIHELLGIPPFKPNGVSRVRSPRITGGISGLFADIKAILPLQEIKELYYEKLENSPAFKHFIERLSTPQFQEFINAILIKEEVIIIIETLKSNGVDVQAFADLLSTILGLEFPNSRSIRTTLNDDLKDFLALLPTEKITEIALNYLENDAEVQKVVDYLQSKEFHRIVEEVESFEEARKILAFLQESGLDVYTALNAIHQVLGFEPFVPSRLARKHLRISGGLSGLLADITAILPIEEIKELYKEKLESSPAFANLVKRLASSEFHEIIADVLVKEEIQSINEKLKAHGIDVEAFAHLLSDVFGLHSRARIAQADLNDDLQDFLALLPVEKITEIALNYLENDAEVQKVVEYLQSDEFHKIVKEVENLKEAREILAFLQESGLNVYDWLNAIHEYLGFSPFEPSHLARKRDLKISGGLTGLINDITAILPVEEIKALYEKKLETSPAFANLIKRLGSPDFHKLIDDLLEKSEVKAIIKKLKEQGVDVQVFVDFLSEIFGLHSSKSFVARASQELANDFGDFIELLPLQAIVDISVDYLFNDAEFQKAVQYIKSDELKSLATNAQQNDEFRNFVNYLDDSGLPAYTLINALNKYLDIPEVAKPKLGYATRRTGTGIRGLLDEIKALLPHESIKQLYEHKKTHSDAFIYFIKRLEDPEFQDIVNKLVLNKDFQKLGYRAADFGIDLKTIVDFSSQLFGIEISEDLLPHTRFVRSALDNDLAEFVQLLPMKKIRKIVTKHYLFDNEFKRALKYVRSGEFHNLVRKLQQIPEYQLLLKSLEETGFDVKSAIAQIHKLINFSGRGLAENVAKKYNIAGLINELKAVLPINEINALYHQKLETSEDFVHFVELIKSKEFQAVTNALFADETFQHILHKLQGYGVDLEVVSRFFLEVFGIETPPGVINY